MKFPFLVHKWWHVFFIKNVRYTDRGIFGSYKEFDCPRCNKRYLKWYDKEGRLVSCRQGEPTEESYDSFKNF